MDALMKQDLQPDLPDPGPAAHLLGYLFDVGPVMSGGMGPVPLSHSEIHAWQQNTGVELRAWESSTLRRLSIEYLSVSADARDPACPAPYTAVPQEDRRYVVSKMIGATLGARAKAERLKVRH